MDIGVEISLYPLNADFIPPIQSFIDRLNAQHPKLKVVTTSLSTQIFGSYEEVFGALRSEILPTFERDGKAVFVLKIIGPLASPDPPAG